MEPKKNPFTGDESFDKPFDKIMRDDGEGLQGEEVDDGAEEEVVLSRRELRLREREEKRRKEEEEFRNINEYWYKDPNINVKIPKLDAPYEELDMALLDNRAKLEELKRAYCRSRRRQHKTITDAYLHEIKRHVNAIEGIKDALAARGDEFRVYYTDREHPIESCRRIVFDCFVASTIYGPCAYETNVLRLYRDVKLSATPWGRLLVKTYYGWLGPAVSRLLKHFTWLQKPARITMDWIFARIVRSL